MTHQHPLLRACAWTAATWAVAIVLTVLVVLGVACGVVK